MSAAPLRFERVLAGALAGAALASMLAWPTHRWLVMQDATFPFLGCFLGAVLGIRVVVGKGGTARWVALIASGLVWWGAALLFYRLPFLRKEWQEAAVPHLAILLSGWSALVWRAMTKLGGEEPVWGWAALAATGLLVGRLVEVCGMAGAVLIASTFFTGSHGMEAIIPLAGMVVTATAAGLLCGLGALAALAGRPDIPWTRASWLAAVVAMVFWAGALILSFSLEVDLGHLWTMRIVMGLWLFPGITWFAWWGDRVAKMRDADDAAVA